MSCLVRGLGALALLIGGVTLAEAGDGPVRLQVPADLAKGLAALPRIAAPRDAAEEAINAALARLDAKARKAAAECRKESGGRGSWERTVAVAMRGPRFLSYAITDSAFCGGAHPNAGTMAIVYDLVSGAPVDWTTLLPPALTGQVALATGMDGTRMVTLASRRLHALYLAGYRPKTDSPKAEAAEDAACREAVASGFDTPPAMMAWLDAREGGLALSFDLPHAVQACADAVVIPTAVLRQEGAKPLLLQAVEAAHATTAKP
ncbi:hypothetical protein [Methylobacterium nodulans]|uniref:Uncharacterized protein n=1 Tax=Methylobacterium nodulans (strain LMG 21967 / CNCM I-2342 / ORS 2060) TaxID=460265 RepID=B8IQ90_METNO|nr:hypothetical protein [Methylobacterium nodulans]ACL58590.1 conserved hypothetical protein [Methylobacterium nodulans ORS 2060]